MNDEKKIEAPRPPVESLKAIDLTEWNTIVTAQHTIARGGGTGKEVPKNIVNSGEEPWNKWI